MFIFVLTYKVCKSRHNKGTWSSTVIESSINREFSEETMKNIFDNQVQWQIDIRHKHEYLRSRASRCLSLSSSSSDISSNMTNIEMLVLISWILHPRIFVKEMETLLNYVLMMYNPDLSLIKTINLHIVEYQRFL